MTRLGQTITERPGPQPGVLSAQCAKNSHYNCYKLSCGCRCHTAFNAPPIKTKGTATKSAASHLRGGDGVTK